MDELSAIGDPGALLEFAWAMEPPLRLIERSAALDRLQAMIDAGDAPPAPAGRDWQLEVWAERAIDAVAADRLDEAMDIADRVLTRADGGADTATARAMLAQGRALAWRGTEESVRAGESRLIEAAERFATLGQTEWYGITLFWLGHAICAENGRPREAETLMTRALEILPFSSPRRSNVLGFYADILVDLGEWDRADAALDEGYRLAEAANDAKGRAYVTWTRAHVAAGRGDTVRAERLFREVERDATDWWQPYGAVFLCDAARTLDTLCLTDQARGYLERAHALVESDENHEGVRPEDFEPLAVARALLTARSGDPGQALDELQALARRRWMEKRLLWRYTLLGAWASLRAGDRETAATEASRAFGDAAARGGVTVATAAEPDISAALAPLATEAGSSHARSLLTRDAQLVVRLFGSAHVSTPQGESLNLPAGRPGELVRMLALHPHGLPVEVVLEEFFPDTPPATSRHRLRQVLTRLRSGAGDIVIRDGEMLSLVPAWVDVREFRTLARRSRASRGTRALILAEAARALAGRGPLLVSDVYAAWSEEMREGVASDLESLRVGPDRDR